MVLAFRLRANFLKYPKKDEEIIETDDHASGKIYPRSS